MAQDTGNTGLYVVYDCLLMSRLQLFHSGNRGSNPLGDAIHSMGLLGFVINGLQDDAGISRSTGMSIFEKTKHCTKKLPCRFRLSLILFSLAMVASVLVVPLLNR